MSDGNPAVASSSDVFMPVRGIERPDHRFGEHWTRGQAVKNWLIRAAVHAALATADVTPERALVALGAFAGRFLRLFMRGARKTALDRALRCLPPERAREVARECFARAGENLATCVLLRRAGVRALDKLWANDAARATLAEALRERRGAVFVSAHLGPFEAVAAAVAELGYRPVAVVRESYDPRLNRAVDAHRRQRGIDVIHRGSPGAAAAIVRALKAGRPVGFLPDLGARVPSIELDFLGDRVAFPVGPQRIAVRTGAPLLVGTLSRPASSFGPHELAIDRIAPADDSVELTQRVAAALEAAILRSPWDWLWMTPPIRRLPPEKPGR